MREMKVTRREYQALQGRAGFLYKQAIERVAQTVQQEEPDEDERE
jgi:hypothetical protein